jgi:hypothetical protein
MIRNEKRFPTFSVFLHIFAKSSNNFLSLLRYYAERNEYKEIRQ